MKNTLLFKRLPTRGLTGLKAFVLLVLSAMSSQLSWGQTPNGLELNSKSSVKTKKANLGFVFFFTLLFSLFGFVQNATSQTTLAVGDLSIIGFNSNAPDNFAFVTWVPIANNTYIKFTDNGFLSTGSATAANNGRGGENFVIWRNNTGSTIAAGTVITIQDNTTASTNLGTIVSGNLNGISNSGDQLFAYQGSATSGANPDWASNSNPTTFNGTILFGLNFGTNWLPTGTPSSNTSYLPSQLNVANGNIAFSTSSTSRGQYTGSRNNQATLAAYKALVNNSANWTTGTGNSGVITLTTTAFTTVAVIAPTAPTIGTITPSNGQLSVAFTVPSSDGGAAISNYQYSTNGGTTFTSFSPAQTSSPVVLTGLTNGTSYSVLLKAVNSVGAGTASNAVSGTPRTVPSAVSSFVVTEGDSQLSLAFTAGSNGGSAITDYEYSLNGGSTFTSASSTTSPIVITGLTNGSTYPVQLRAVNVAGTGIATASASATPRTISDAPSITAITAGNSQLSVAFSAPTFNGGAAISNYKYSVNGGLSYIAAGTTTSPIVITGLANGTTYDVQLLAVNVAGDGTPSSIVQGTPVAPSTPTIVANKVSLNSLSTIYGTASSTDNFTVSGASLLGDITVTAPAGFEVSTTSNSTGFASSQILTQTSGSVASTIVYVRLAASATVISSPYTGDLVISSSGATNTNVATSASTVAVKELTISGLTGDDKTYNGSLTATVSGTAVLDGIVGADAVLVSGSPSFSFANENAGTNKSITASGYALTGADSANYSVAQPTYLTATITKADQTITAISPLETRTYGNNPYNVSTTASSGLVVSYSSSNTSVATVDVNGNVTIVGAGSTIITASQGGDLNYNPALNVEQALTVNLADQSLAAITATVNKSYGDAPYSAATTASSGLAVSYSSSDTNVATVASNGFVAIVGVGTTTIIASQSGNANYNPALSVSQELTVIKGDQTITLAATDTKTTATTTYTLTQNASSGLAISYASSNSSVATISGNTVTILGAGATTITANQVGNVNYNPAPEATQVLTVTPVASPIVGWNMSALTGGSNNFGPSPFAPSTSVANVTNGSLTRGSGVTTSGTAATRGWGGLGWDYATADLAVAANRFITFTTKANAGYSMSISSLNPFGYRASGTGATSVALQYQINSGSFTTITTFTGLSTSSSGGTFASTDLTAVTALQNLPSTSTVTFRIVPFGASGSTGTFYIFDTANSTASDLAVNGFVQQSATPSITSSLTANGTFGAAFTYTTTATNSPTSYSATGLPSGLSIETTTGAISGTPLAAGIFDVSLTATNSNGEDTKTLVITVAKSNQVLNFNALASKTYGDDSFILNGTSTSGLTLTYSSSNTDVATISGNTVTILGAGTTSITASQTGDDNYFAAIDVTQNFTINKATLIVTAVSQLVCSGTDASVVLASGSSEISGFVQGEDSSVITGAATYTTSYNSTIVAGTTGIIITPVVDQLTATNYQFGIETGAITIEATTTNTTTISECDSYTWPINNQIYTVSGSYSVVLPNCVTEILNLTITASPVITTQPVPPSICNFPGSSATITVGVQSTLTPSYSWYSQLADSTDWILLTDDPTYQGSGTASLTITKTILTIPDFGFKYFPLPGTKFKVEITAGDCVPLASNEVVLNEVVLSKPKLLKPVEFLTPKLSVCSGSTIDLRLDSQTVGNIQWQSSIDNINWTNEGVPVAQSAISVENPIFYFTSGILLQDTWFRVTATNGICGPVIGEALKITVSAPAVAGTIIGGNVTVCAPLASGLDSTGVALTAPITTNTILTLTGSTNVGSIVWEKSTDYVNDSIAANWSPIANKVATTAITASYSGAGTAELAVGNLGETTWYRAVVTNGACTDYSGTVKITATPIARIGVITSSSTSVCQGDDITFTCGAIAGNSFRWEISTTSAFSGYSTISGATGLQFVMQNVTNASPTGKFYVRTVATGDCNMAISGILTITVSPASVGGIATGGGTICPDTNGTLSVSGQVGRLLQWESSSNGVDYVNVPTGLSTAGATYISGSATGSTSRYLVTNITADTYFRVKTTSGTCSEAYSNVIKYSVVVQAEAGTISSTTSTICAGSGATLTLDNSVGTVTWKKSVNWTSATPIWTTITSRATTPITNNGTTLGTGSLLATTAYQATVAIGSCSVVSSNIQIVTVDSVPVGGTVAVNTTGATVCLGGSKSMKVTGSVGIIQWQRSTTSATEGFEDVAGATTTPYTFENINAPTWFRVVATNGVCANAVASSAVEIAVTTTPAVAGTISGNPSVCRSSATSLFLSGSSGTIVWQRATVVNGIVGTFINVLTNTVVTVTNDGVGGSTLTTGNLTASTAYRVMLTSGSCVAYTPTYIVSISPLAKVTAITGFNTVSTPLCVGTATTLSIANGYIGTIQWLSSSTLTGVYSPIIGETGATYNYTPTSAATMYFKVRMTSSPCSIQATTVTGVAVFATSCSSVSSKVSVSKISVEQFNVKAYPNPFTSAVQLDFTTTSKNPFEMKVYDMTGKLVEVRQFSATEMNHQDVGNNYSSGVYNVIVTQGEQLKTLRVIKK